MRHTLGFWIIGLALLSGCASKLPPEEFLNPSFSRPQSAVSQLQAAIADKLAKYPGKSAVSLLESGEDALYSRLALIDMAEHDLALQYYIWNGDHSGLLILERVIAAAERGVRVRLLIDDHNLLGNHKSLATLSKLPNVYIKLYNPYGGAHSAQFTKTLTLIGDLRRLNHRMHNKALIADNQVAIIGGRNIGDEYFDLSKTKNFVDLDVITLGPVVGDISRSFDAYWNSQWAVSAQTIDPTPLSNKEANKLRRKYYKQLRKLPSMPYTVEFTQQELWNQVEDELKNMHWANISLAVDVPGKSQDDAPDGPDMIQQILEKRKRPEKEVMVVSPYFVPDGETLEYIDELEKTGARIQVITSSYDSNDVRVAQYGYIRRRQQVLDRGVELFEYRADSQYWRQHQVAEIQQVPLALHAKFSIYDGKSVLIGSANIDPRSKDLNSEIGLLIESEPFAQELRQWFINNSHPRNAAKVLRYNNKLFWRVEDENGEEKILTKEPGSHWWDIFGLSIQYILPVEEHL
ncbi:phospholipase D family protein [Paraferrimonas sedimenticola]|uniref:Phospholipase D family protein n=1 Tax=Paraferrimonas sedimenticola TaxID=375674 RepID=A0AA37VZC8_9GAMM|nr:phospholipase D family protein [Paraferrimonas sedimenticola]GLP97119.1 phospholipase D family protein [Paraferrimonas sedimenticola]